MLLSGPVQSARICKLRQLRFAYRWYSPLEIVLGDEWPIVRSRLCDSITNLLPQTSHIAKADSHSEWVAVLVTVCPAQLLQCAIPSRLLNVDGPNLQAVELGIVDESRWPIKAHRLVVEHGAGVCGAVIEPRVGPRIRKRGK